MLRYAIGLVAMLTIFSSCDSKFKLTGEYKEKALIYGLLDPNDNPNVGGKGHLFRIQKGFLGEESAFVMAQNADSSYFKYENLFVEMIEYEFSVSGNKWVESNRWSLDTVNIGNKETGNPDDGEIDFFGPTQRLYKTKTDAGPKQVNINPDREYEITLKKRPSHIPIDGMNLANMDTVTPIADARTEIVDTTSFSWNTPSRAALTNPNNPQAAKMEIFNNLGQFRDYTIRFDVAQNAIKHEVWMRFYYREVLDGNETVKTLEWKAATFDLALNTNSWQVQLAAANIYSKIGSEVKPIPNVVRYIGLKDGAPGDILLNDGHSHDFDFFIRMAGNELNEYININNPSSSGALQDKPVYTNVNNGLGVFSSRTSTVFRGLYLSDVSAQQLVDGAYTKGLGFVDD